MGWLSGKEYAEPRPALGSGEVEGRYSKPSEKSTTYADAFTTSGLIQDGMDGAMMGSIVGSLLDD